MKKYIVLVLSTLVLLLIACQAEKPKAPLAENPSNISVDPPPARKDVMDDDRIPEPVVVANQVEAIEITDLATKTGKQPNEMVQGTVKEVNQSKSTKTPTEKVRATAPTAAPVVMTAPPADSPAAPSTPTPVEATPKPEPMVEDNKIEVAAFNHDIFDNLLKKHVSNSGKVDYKGFTSDRLKLEEYLKSLENQPVESGWSSSQKLAYWINAYNAYTIKLIMNNYPVKSITDLEGGKPWDKKWINLNGKTLSLNNIENDIIRPTFKEPRIHFAVNCAAKSCPPLHNRAWTAENLKSTLEKKAKGFINNPAYNKIDENKVQVSKIFEWYGADFGDLKAYLNKYSDTKIGAGTKIEFLEYDWALNE